MMTKQALLALGVSLCALATASPAAAQQSPDQQSQDQDASAPQAASADGVIVVTARRRDEDVQDVPAVIQAVTANELRDLNIRNLTDVSAVVPGLALGNNANGIGSVTTIRGVDFNVNASGDNGTVQYYYNDSPVSSGLLLQALYDIGQIEVSRGPQGTLKGRASPSGAISVTFKRPDLYEAGGYAEGTVNDLDGYNFNGALNVPIIEGLAAIRVAGLVSNGEGNRVLPRDAGTRDPKLEDRTESMRVSARLSPFDGRLMIDGSYLVLETASRQFQQVQSGSDFDPAEIALYPTQTIGARDRLSANYLPFDVRQRFENINISASAFAFGQQLTYVGNWMKQHFLSLDPILTGDGAGLFSDPYTAQFHVNFDQSIPAPILPTGATVPLQQFTDSGSKNQSHEIRLQNEDRIAGMFDYVAGYLRFTQDTDTNFAQMTGVIPNVGPGGAILPRPNGVIFLPLQRPGSTKEESIFGNVTVSLTERTKLSGGLRHIWYRSEAGVNLCGNIDFTGCFPNPALQTDLKAEATIFQLSAQQFLSDGIMVYASFGTSWRPDAQFIGGAPFPTPRQADLASTPPEKSRNYEIGLKSTLMDGRLRLNLTGYYQEFDNYPYRAPGSGVFGIRYAQPGSGQAATVEDDNYLSAVPVEVKGFEAEVAFDILHNWSISGILSYADGKIKNGAIACLDLDGDGTPDGAGGGRPTVPQIEQSLGGDGDPTTADTPGVALCNVSQRSASSSPFAATLKTEYVQPVNTNAEAVARALYSFRGNSIGDPTNPRDSVASFGLLNLYAGLRSPDRTWEITGYVKNVFDTFRVLTRDSKAAATQLAGGTAFDRTNYFNVSSTAPREFGITARFAFGSR